MVYTICDSSAFLKRIAALKKISVFFIFIVIILGGPNFFSEFHAV